MNILFINYNAAFGEYNPSICCDYQMDTLFHGLKELGHNVYDYPKMHHQYKNCTREGSEKIWGKGFTTCFLLDDRPDLEDNDIRDYDWDLVILPLHHSVIFNHNEQIGLYNSLIQKFKANKIVIVDGHDFPDLNPLHKSDSPMFKRELFSNIKNVFPIHFGIPECKIQTKKEKEYDVAPLIPVNQNIDSSYMKTYIYKDEESYYDMYNKSRIALTSKKGGWDSMRTLEIIACNSVPYFVDIESCPENCLFDFPKDLFKEIKEKIKVEWNWTGKDYGTQWPHCGVVNIDSPGKIIDFDESYYSEIQEKLITWLKNYGTTKSIAKYLLEKVL